MSLRTLLEAQAQAMRLAGYPIKSIRLASLYRPAPTVLTITWGMPDVWLDQPGAPAGVRASSVTRPADTCILLPAPERLHSLEADVLAAAWQLGAWDVARLERARLANPDEYLQSRYGLSEDFGINAYTILGQPITTGDTAPDAQIREAAKQGWLIWRFVPLALSASLTRKTWGVKDRTLTDLESCRRTPRVIEPYRLFGPVTDPGTAHDHIYTLGRGNHGNRSKKSSERRA